MILGKKLLVAIIALLAMPFANAVSIVPPAIYFVTLSIGSLLANIALSCISWLAIQGVFSRKELGKDSSNTIKSLFSFIKNAFIIAVSISIPAISLMPKTEGAIILSAVISGFLGFIVYLFISAREIIIGGRLLASRILSIGGVLFIFIAVAAYVSLSLAIDETAIDTQGAFVQEIKFPDKSGIQRSPEPGIQCVFEYPAGNKIAGAPLDSAGMPAPGIEEIIWHEAESILFFPFGMENCVIETDAQKIGFIPIK